MSKTALSLAGVALLATSAAADLTLGTFDLPAADSSEVKTLYGASSFSNANSPRSLAVKGGALELTTTLGMDADAYSANAGIIVPLNNLWAPKDIRSATAVTFDIWGSSKFKVNFALGSEIYPFSDKGVVKVTNLNVTTAKQSVTIGLSPVCELEYLEWMDDAEKYPDGINPVYVTDPSDPDYANADLNVAMAVKQVQFNIDPTWGTGGKSVTAPAGATTLSVDNIVVVGANKYDPVVGLTCGAGLPSVVFSPMTGETFDQNMTGGYWYTFADDEAAGDALGASKINLGTAKKWHMDTANGAVVLNADLNKIVDGAFHKYAGFAAVGTGAPEMTYLDLTGLVGMSFAMMIPEGLSIDPTKVEGVHFQVQEMSVGDSVTHEVMIPGTQVAAGEQICVDIDQLKMPDWYRNFEDGTPRPGYVPFSPHDVVKFNWMLKLNEGDTAAAAQGFAIGPVTFYGLAALPDPILTCDPEIEVCPDAVKGRVVRSAFTASYANSILSVKGLEGYKTVDVLSLTGARVASFKVGSAAKIRLDRGAYMLVARGEGMKTMSRTLAVAK
ncbi:MAG: hypothetical protein H6686_03530 [Fibrobacteria bacterium]|nr:hypothetical protein [Fibrobacteria bacterium]